MDLFALNGVNKGAFSQHVIAPHHPSSNQNHRTISRLRKECTTVRCILESWNDGMLAGTLEHCKNGVV
jgi:hypothetical protein